MGRTTDADPRYVRVRTALRAAVLDLASTDPAETLSVQQLTAAAGVSRQSFYAHATSPADLLAHTLIEELQPEIDTLTAAISDPHASDELVWRSAYLAVLDHVQHHAEVYRTMIEQDSHTFTVVIAAFEPPARAFILAIASRFLEGDPGPLWKEMAVQQQIGSLTAVIRAWIATGTKSSPEAVVDTYMTLAPPWQLARRDASGHISMRRTRVPGAARSHEAPDQDIN